MTREQSRCTLLSLTLCACLAVPGSNSIAQGFDPGKVDWEKLSKIPMKDSFIKQFNDQCGACHVLVDGRAVAACSTPLWAVAGKAVVTVEGLGQPEAPHPLQRAFLDEQAAQCGYCTPGMLMSAAALLARVPHPTADEVRAALDRNLCRCGSHNRIVRAVLRAAGAGAAP